MKKAAEKLTLEQIKKVADYLLVETPPERVDLGFVFGCRSCDPLADHVAALYHAGYFPKILVAGGVATDDGRLEADRIRDRLVEKGVPPSAILLERASTNTGENIRFALPVLDKAMGLENIGSVMAMGWIHAARRFLMTLEKHMPGVHKVSAPYNGFGVPKAQWAAHPQFREAVIAEIGKLKPYKEAGFLTEIARELWHPQKRAAAKKAHSRKKHPKHAKKHRKHDGPKPR